MLQTLRDATSQFLWIWKVLKRQTAWCKYYWLLVLSSVSFLSRTPTLNHITASSVFIAHIWLKVTNTFADTLYQPNWVESIIDTYHQRFILSHLPCSAKFSPVPMEDYGYDITGFSFSQTKGVGSACESCPGCRGDHCVGLCWGRRNSWASNIYCSTAKHSDRED
jgi:hypothetical protein